MNVQDYLEKMTLVHTCLLNYLDDETNNEILYQKLIDTISEKRIRDNQHEIKSFLYLLLKLSKNHHRSINFFNKIDRVLAFFKNDMKKYFTNSELFHIFKGNKRILLFLLEEKIMIIDEFFVKKILTNNLLSYYLYPQYFLPEIKPFVNEKWFPKSKEWLEKIEKDKISDDFITKRKEGENDNFICELIRKDLIDDFIVYVNQNLYPHDSKIQASIFETNSFLLRYGANLIEYAAFFGSIQIFNYLRLNNVPLTPSLWFYAIHGKNADIIHILEENQVNFDEEIQMIFRETIKCHHNDFANYIKDQYLLIKPDNLLNNCLKYYNFNYMQNDLINESLFCTLCTYDYYLLVDFFLREKSDVINDVIIQIFYI